MPRPLNSLGKSRRYPWKWVGPRSCSNALEARNISSAGNRSSNPRLSSPLASLYTEHTTPARFNDYWTCNKWTILTGGDQHRNQSSCGGRHASTIVRPPEEAAVWLRSWMQVISLHLPHVTQHVPGFPPSGNNTDHLSHHRARLMPRLVKSLKQWFLVCGPQAVIVKHCFLLNLTFKNRASYL